MQRYFYVLIASFTLLVAFSCQLPEDPKDESSGASSALSSPATLDLSSTDIDIFRIDNDQKNNSIGIAVSGSKIYIFELEEGAGADSAGIPDAGYNERGANSLLRLLNASGGSAIADMEVNPYTKQVYLLSSNQKLYRFNVDANGAGSVSAVDLSSVRGIELSVPASVSDNVNDVAWSRDENTLYASYGGQTLSGKMAWAKGPFDSDFTISTTANESQGYRDSAFTRTFSSSRHNNHTTSAPIERLSVASIGGKVFLSGENTCSPMFSEETSTIRSGKTLIDFVETFNMIQGTPKKIFHGQDSLGTTYLLVVRAYGQFNLDRVGQEFIDGSYNNDPSKSNANTTRRPFIPSPDFPEAQFKTLVSGNVIAADVYAKNKVLVATRSGLKFYSIGD